MAIADPPSPDGRPGAVHFSPNVPLTMRRWIVNDLEYLERMDRCRKDKKEKAAEKARKDGVR